MSKRYILILWFLLLTTVCFQVYGQNSESAQQNTSDKISLQLRDIDLTDVFRTLSEKSGMNIVAEAGVKGRVTLFLDDVKPKEALDIITKLYDLAYVKDGNTILVFTAQRYEAIYGKKFRDLTKMKVFPLKNTLADRIAPQLTSLKSKDGYVVTDSRSNSIIAVDVPKALREFADLIEVLDVPVSTRSFPLEHSSPAVIKEAITPFLSPSASIIIDGSTNRLLITDAKPNLDRISDIIEEYDIQPKVLAATFNLKYIPVESLAPKVSPQLTTGLGTIQMDSKTNSLIVTDLPSILDNIETIIKTFDRKPTEVLIEAKILQISLDEGNKLGVNWEAITDEIDNTDITISAQFRVLGDADEGLSISGGVLSEDRYTALIEMLATEGKTDLLSSPRLLVMNNTEARILVGSTVPYKTIDTREEDGTIRTFEKVTMTDVGVKLYVTPTISPDSVITMKIRPEVSSVTGYSDNIPIVEKSETETVVMVKDGATVLIGGLVREELRDDTKGIPILCKIPILGALFRSKTTQKLKTEMAIFITPRIVSGEVSDLENIEGLDLKNFKKKLDSAKAKE